MRLAAQNMDSCVADFKMLSEMNFQVEGKKSELDTNLEKANREIEALRKKLSQIQDVLQQK